VERRTRKTEETINKKTPSRKNQNNNKGEYLTKRVRARAHRKSKSKRRQPTKRIRGGERESLYSKGHKTIENKGTYDQLDGKKNSL